VAPTAHALARERRRRLDAGFYDELTKPRRRRTPDELVDACLPRRRPPGPVALAG
jgi:hypothetical protein